MPPEIPAVRLLLVDDHPAVREGLALLLTGEGICACGEAGGRAEALARAARCAPTLALVDLSLGDEDGLGLLADLHARGLPTLVYSMHGDLHHVERAFAAGALGYVTKRELQGVLVQAIREVAAGRRFVSPHAAQALAEGFVLRNANARGVERALSDREWQVYQFVGRGEGTVEIAAVLHVSVRTVESYYARILAKLNLNSMRDLRRHAVAHHGEAAP